MLTQMPTQIHLDKAVLGVVNREHHQVQIPTQIHLIREDSEVDSEDQGLGGQVLEGDQNLEVDSEDQDSETEVSAVDWINQAQILMQTQTLDQIHSVRPHNSK